MKESASPSSPGVSTASIVARTSADASTVADAVRILEKYGIQAPERALHETPKAGDARV